MQHHHTRSILVILLTGFLLLPGCTGSKYGAQKTRVNYYPQCYQPVSDLRQDEGGTETSTAVGGVTGALLGALVGALATGKVEGAVAGAAVGGATGAVAGNIYGKNQSRQQDEAYYRAYAQQLGTEAAGMNRATAAAKIAANCYDAQFKQAVGQFRAGQISRVEFQQRYDEIRSGLEETSYILGSTASTMARKDSEYQQALSEQYVQAKPASPKARKASKPSDSSVADQARAWKGSREELENTRQDVDSRLNAYSQTVDNLLL